MTSAPTGRSSLPTGPRAVYTLFKKYDSFFEYNSPTYYGVDLYGLALWRDYGSTQRMQTIGSEMEATIWKDIAAFYNPLLRNVSGPYDRSYGMDMESYVSVVGVWMRTVLDAKNAPLPPIAATTDHVAGRMVRTAPGHSRHTHPAGSASQR